MTVWPKHIAIGAVVLFAVVIAACSNQPSPEVVGTTAREGFSGFLDHTVWVACTIRNNGKDGNIEVIAELRGGGSWKKRETLHISKNQEEKISIAFPEVDLIAAGLGGFQYNCIANAK